MMKTFRILMGVSITVLSVSGLFLSGCKDHVPPAKPKLSFSQTSRTVNEADGDIEIKLKLDKGAFEDFKITWELGGTATDKVAAGTTKSYDYEVTSDYLETKIVKGDSIGIIKIKLWSDLSIEDDEVIEITIKDVDSDNVEITRSDEIKITIKQEDGMVVALEWGVGTGEKYLDVDMDLFLWAKNSASELVLTGIGSASPGYTSPEFFFLPYKPFTDGTYGLSCNYYEGTADPMNFVVSFVKVVNGSPGATVTRKGTYTLANVNPWDTSKVDPLLVLTFDKLGNDFTNFSEITIPTQGSRSQSTGNLPSSLKKQSVDPRSRMVVQRLLQ